MNKYLKVLGRYLSERTDISDNKVEGCLGYWRNIPEATRQNLGKEEK